MKKVVLALSLLATSALALAIIIPSLVVSNGTTTFGATSDSSSYTSTIVVDASYSTRRVEYEFESEFYDANGLLIGTGSGIILPPEYLATCATTQSGTYVGSLITNGRATLVNDYRAQPKKIQDRIKSGRYRFWINEELADGCSSFSGVAASDTYVSPWSPAYSF